MSAFINANDCLLDDDIASASFHYGPRSSTNNSIYSVPIIESPNSSLSAASESIRFHSKLENKFVDLYQFEVPRTTAMKFDLSSPNINTKLLVLEILPNQALGNLVLEKDDISANDSNSSIEHTLAPTQVLD